MNRLIVCVCLLMVMPLVLAKPPEGYQLHWSDEFNQQSLDQSKWAYRVDNKHRSLQLRENVQLQNGFMRLQLTVANQARSGKKAFGAGIISKARFRYGYYEVRARLGDGIDQDGDGKFDEGWHHSFWAMAAAIKGDVVDTTYPGIRRTEIDGFENPTEHLSEPEQNGLSNFSQHVIIWNEDGSEWGRLPVPPTDVSRMGNFDAGEWHRYGFSWDEEKINFYVDDKLAKTANYPAQKFVHDNINVWLTAIAAQWNSNDQELSRADYDYFRFYLADIGKTSNKK